MKHIRPFVKKLQSLYPDMQIEYYDERFTSALAQQKQCWKQTKKNKTDRTKAL
jgi:hypothetical protein